MTAERGLGWREQKRPLSRGPLAGREGGWEALGRVFQAKGTKAGLDGLDVQAGGHRCF